MIGQYVISWSDICQRESNTHINETWFDSTICICSKLLSSVICQHGPYTQHVSTDHILISTSTRVIYSTHQHGPYTQHVSTDHIPTRQHGSYTYHVSTDHILNTSARIIYLPRQHGSYTNHVSTDHIHTTSARIIYQPPQPESYTQHESYTSTHHVSTNHILVLTTSIIWVSLRPSFTINVSDVFPTGRISLL